MPYAYIGEISLDGGELTIFEHQQSVTLTGQHLGKLYQFMLQHRVAWVKESDSAFEEEEGKPFIASIIIQSNQ